MPIALADLSLVSRLLDTALDLEPAQREAWLASLPQAEQHLAPALRAMLQEYDSTGQTGRLAGPPAMPDWPDPPDSAVASAGERVGPYRLLRSIGRGGMGSVWLAERVDGALSRQVALKLPRLTWDGGLARRMARERDIGALLEHPHIARLYDAGVDELGRPFLALEYIDGQPIDAWCTSRKLDVPERLRLFLQVVRAVAYAHGRLVIHRDLKPANVLVSPDGQAHLLDFGIARLLQDTETDGSFAQTQELHRALSPRYASPEQISGLPLTVQSDVYSLGVLLYELLTGVSPIRAKRTSPGALEDAVLSGDIPTASKDAADPSTARALRGDLDAILTKATQRDPKRRYTSAEALADDIERQLAGRPVLAQPDRWAYRWGKVLIRHRLGIVASIAALSAAVGLASVAYVQAKRATEQTQRAFEAREQQRMVTDFVADLFRPDPQAPSEPSSSPHRSAKALLDRAVLRIASRFDGRPRLQAELYGAIGGAFADMTAYNLAADVLMRRVTVLDSIPSEPSEQAEALLACGQALLAAQMGASAEAQVRRALGLARGNQALELDATVLLARVLLNKGSIDAAEAQLARGSQIAAQIHPQPLTAMAWMGATRGRILMHRNRLDEAIPVFEQAVQTARVGEGPNSLTAVAIELTLADQLGQTNNADRARSHFDSAAGVLRALGGAHRIRAAYAAASFAWRMYAGGGNGTLAEALSTIEASRRELLSSDLPMPDWFVPMLDFWLGSIKAEAGDVVAGLRTVDLAKELHAELIDSLFARMSIAATAGDIWMFAGRHDLADKWFREELVARDLTGGSRHPYTATAYHHIAQNLLMAGRLDEAEAILDQAPRFDGIKGYGPDADRYNRLLIETRAQVLLARSRASDALKLVEREPPHLELPSGDDGFDRTVTAFGESLCAVGRSREGLPVLKAWLAKFLAQDHHANAPWLGRLRAVIGNCALALGDRRTALEMSELARSTFTSQPDVSPYYKAPLATLESALGLKRSKI